MKPFYLLPLLAACQVVNNGAVTVIAPSGPEDDDTVVAAPSPEPTPTPLPTVTLPYWTLTKVTNPLGLSTAISLTGYCTVLEGATYCWDDGIKTQTRYYGLQQSTFSYTFWGVGFRVAAWDLCHGNCQNDMVEEPTLMTNLAQYAIYSQATPAEVMHDGVQRDATCTVSQSALECGAFRIDFTRVSP